MERAFMKITKLEENLHLYSVQAYYENGLGQKPFETI